MNRPRNAPHNAFLTIWQSATPSERRACVTGGLWAIGLGLLLGWVSANAYIGLLTAMLLIVVHRNELIASVLWRELETLKGRSTQASPQDLPPED
ncbi:MAG: hypothetical protein EA001_01560 [Oscillatoriales cyanobacterium]|nr:MAG: hypothetical protein EA001_01560 [Oscillatoriales cyanobacterium]